VLVVVVIGLLLVAGGVVVFRGLTDAALYYYNADEAVAQRDQLGDDRIRVQGTVEPGVREAGGDVTFDIAFEGVTMAVRHRGDPPDLFQPGIPVVLEGRWQGDRFASDRMLIKHSSEYKAENPDRVPGQAP
jgi:cytochrome c-type biogenesis protein CcmE